ncbi:hypothetical protein [Paenibacillus ginsengihumi]|uniref:hypothetical protein n=1 Tax=Paenibacillus ginsengihumi TaxID=431596 RepID=UPI00036E5CED|nr:hypothetical protein [Paenibacillus ginsengihumi]
MKHERRNRERLERDANDALPKENARERGSRKERSGFAEEYAAEVAFPYSRQRAAEAVKEGLRAEPAQAKERRSQAAAPDAYRWVGLTSLALSVLSLFVLPAVFGSAASLLGFFAYMVGQRSLGIWSVVIGLLSLAGYFVLVPLYA